MFKKFYDRLRNVELLRSQKKQILALEEKVKAQEVAFNKELSDLRKGNKKLQEELKKYHKTWESVSKYDIRSDLTYYVVTQGGYYAIKGWKLKSEVGSEVTKRAYKNGFVVRTEDEAMRLQEAIKRLGW